MDLTEKLGSITIPIENAIRSKDIRDTRDINHSDMNEDTMLKISNFVDQL